MKNLIREGGKILTLRHMKIFTTVYRCGSVTRAAQELHLAQPSLSVAIRELEEHYGVRLFERTGRAISPTQAAGALYGYASHIVSLFDDMEKQMRNWDTLGVLRLGASVTIGTHILPDLIRRYQARVPQLRIEALVEQSSGIERKLLERLCRPRKRELPEVVDQPTGVVGELYADDGQAPAEGRARLFVGTVKVGAKRQREHGVRI